MKKERKNAPYPPYQFQPFSSPYSQPRMDHKGYDHAIHNQWATGPSRKQPEKSETKHREPFSSGNVEEKKASKRSSNPLLYVPPTIINQEIHHIESTRPSQAHNVDQENEFSPEIEEPSTTDYTERSIAKEEKKRQKKKDSKESTLFDKNEKLTARNDDYKSYESIQNESSSIEEEFPLDEELFGKHIALLDESSSIEEGGSFFLYEDESSAYEDKSSLFVLSNFIDDKPDLPEESSSIGEPPLESSSMEESSSCFYESSSMEESSSAEEPFSIQCESSTIDDCADSVAKKDLLPIVKLPVLLAKLEIDIDLLDTFKLPCPVSNISKIDWSLHSLDCQVLLPAPNVFLKGVLIATIEYTDESNTASLHTIKIKVPWKKTETVEWLSLPKLPSSHQAEYMYQGNDCMDIQFHREFTQQYAEPIHSDLERVHYIWHDEVISTDGMQELGIQGGVSLNIQLKQSQYIDLNNLKWS